MPILKAVLKVAPFCHLGDITMPQKHFVACCSWARYTPKTDHFLWCEGAYDVNPPFHVTHHHWLHLKILILPPRYNKHFRDILQFVVLHRAEMVCAQSPLWGALVGFNSHPNSSRARCSKLGFSFPNLCNLRISEFCICQVAIWKSRSYQPCDRSCVGDDEHLFLQPRSFYSKLISCHATRARTMHCVEPFRDRVCRDALEPCENIPASRWTPFYW